jgi:hypothetical protein
MSQQLQYVHDLPQQLQYVHDMPQQLQYVHDLPQQLQYVHDLNISKDNSVNTTIILLQTPNLL